MNDKEILTAADALNAARRRWHEAALAVDSARQAEIKAAEAYDGAKRILDELVFARGKAQS